MRFGRQLKRLAKSIDCFKIAFILRNSLGYSKSPMEVIPVTTCYITLYSPVSVFPHTVANNTRSCEYFCGYFSTRTQCVSILIHVIYKKLSLARYLPKASIVKKIQ